MYTCYTCIRTCIRAYMYTCYTCIHVYMLYVHTCLGVCFCNFLNGLRVNSESTGFSESGLAFSKVKSRKIVAYPTHFWHRNIAIPDYTRTPTALTVSRACLDADFERFQDCGCFIHVVYSTFNDTGVQHGKHKIRIS